MRILDVSPRVVFPPIRGSGVRAYNLLRSLSARHEVRQFSQARPGRGAEGGRGLEQITPSYSELRYANPIAASLGELSVRTWPMAPLLSGLGLRLTRPRELDRLLDWADVVLVEFPWQYAYCRRRRPDRPVVLAGLNVEAAKFRSYAESVGRPRTTSLWVRFVEAVERHAVETADLVLCVSESDRDELERRYDVRAERLVVVPNGADTLSYGPVDPSVRRAARSRLGLPERPTALFVGADVPPNRAGLEWVRRLALRSDHFTFLAAGHVAPPTISEGGLVALGFVDDLALCFAAADFALCPIEFGGGTKIKLLEGLAAALPTVAFEEALTGLPLEDGRHLLVAEKSEKGLLAALERLAGDPELAAAVGAAGRELVAGAYDWARVADALEHHLLRLVSAAPRLTGRRAPRARLRTSRPFARP